MENKDSFRVQHKKITLCVIVDGMITFQRLVFHRGKTGNNPNSSIIEEWINNKSLLYRTIYPVFGWRKYY